MTKRSLDLRVLQNFLLAPIDVGGEKVLIRIM